MKSTFTLALLLAATTTAVAKPQRPPSPDPVPTAPATDPNAQAKQLYVEGKRYYDVGDYKTAIDTWKRAYVISSAPMLLFNIAQAYRLSGDCTQALKVYASYEREQPNPPNKTELDTAKTRCNREPTGANPPDGTATVEPAVVAPPPVTPPVTTTSQLGTLDLDPAAAAQHHEEHREPPPPPSNSRRTTAYVSIGVGVVFVATAIAFGVHASNLASDLESHTGEWTSDQHDQEHSGQRANKVALISGVVGGVAVLTGVSLLVIDSHARRERHLDARITPSSAQVTWFASF